MQNESKTLYPEAIEPISPKQLQVAALCWRYGVRGREVLLITSRGTGRWIMPKGWAMKKHSHAKAALIEAWEEAGVKNARIDPVPIGSYSYAKVMRDGQIVPVMALLFPCEVIEMSEEFPESGQRRLHWTSPARAAAHVDEPGLKALLLSF